MTIGEAILNLLPKSRFEIINNIPWAHPINVHKSLDYMLENKEIYLKDGIFYKSDL